MENKEIDMKLVKKILWSYIGRHGVVVTNGNIDYVLQEAYKEYNNEQSNIDEH
jgi:hypothetical protein